MSTLMSILVSLGMDTKEFDANLTEAEKKAQGFGRSMDKIGGKLQKAGTVMTTAITVPVVAGFTAMINSASDLSETVNKVGVVFGDWAEDIVHFGDSASTALGMSKNEALSAAGTYGNLFRAMGIGAEATTDMSMGLVTLAADLASFNNMNPTEVLDKLRAGLSGETEPLRTLGVNLTAATIEAKALEMGLWSGTGAIDAAAKAQASYALIMEQTTLAQGDFARTSDGLANSTRTLKAQLQDASASLGNSLLPTALNIVTKLKELVQTFNNLSPATQTTIINVAALVAALGPLVTVIGTVVKVVGVVTAFLAGPALLAVAPYAAAILGIALAMKLVVNAAKKHNEAIEDATAGFRKQNRELSKTSESYEDYRRNAIASAKATGVINEYIDMSTAEMYGMGVAEEEAAIKMGVLTKAQYDLQKAVEGATQASKDIIDPQERLRQSMVDSSSATAGLVSNTDLLNQQMDELRLFMSGPLGDEMDSFYQKEGDLQTQAEDLRGEIDNLNGKTWLTGAQKEQLEENKGKLKEVEDQIKRNADEHELATKRILFDLLEQQLAMGGLTTNEGNMLAVIAEKWGLVDETTAGAYQKISEYVTQVQNGTLLVEELADMIAKLGDKDIYLTTHFIETYQSNAPAWQYSGGTGDLIGRARGGSIVEGSPYIYNESATTRPETFVASTNGYMLTRQEAQEAVARGSRDNAGGKGGGNTYQIFSKENPGQIQNALRLSELMGGAA